jgi:large subunit ribosomal protein L4
MLEAPLFSSAGARSASVALPADLFDGTVHEPVLHQAVTAYLNNQRQGTAATRTRAKVSGGNQKPWRQKGTGRARQGTIRAPHWRGGGTVFGPIPRDYRTGIPTRVRQLARRSALNARAREGALLVVEELAYAAPKTAQLTALLEKLGAAGRKTLFLTHGLKRTVYLSGRNVPSVKVLPFTDASAYDILWAEVLVVEQPALGGETIPVAERPARKRAAPRAAKAAAPKAAKARATKARVAKARAPKAKVAKKAAAPRGGSRKKKESE